MSSPVATLVLIAGIALLGLGADVLIRGAVTIAKSLRISAAVIGLTIVSMGTSLPELTVSIAAALRGSSDLALGNAIGSNLFNIGVVLGISAVILPMRVHGSAVRLEWPFMFLASFQLLMLARDGQLDRLEGGFFVTGLALFTWYAVLIGRKAVSGEEASDLEYEVTRRAPLAHLRSLGGALGLIAAGVALLVVGGDLLVRGATVLARAFGMTERMIALTVVAMGTGAPEAFTSIVAARRGQSEIALGNVIGSNIFNILGILGVTAMVRPLTVSAPILHGDLWWMLGLSLLLFPIMRSKGEITRFEGAVLLVAYGTYLGLTAFIH
ncbi:MAG: calcium/sodium antiporter [Gemmatimonadaceae bacterium]|nr:calcium/sodium antiporter [Gemmatimonadaceae bacterium]